MILIALEDISYHAGGFELKRVSLAVPTGAYAVLMGKTGSGKTTLLEILCGLRAVDAGRVLVAGGEVTRRVAQPLQGC